MINEWITGYTYYKRNKIRNENAVITIIEYTVNKDYSGNLKKKNNNTNILFFINEYFYFRI